MGTGIDGRETFWSPACVVLCNKLYLSPSNQFIFVPRRTKYDKSLAKIHKYK